MPYAKLKQVVEKTEYSQQPQNHHNHDNAIQNALDLALHGDKAVHQPQEQADNT
jgi:hypothetical protein